MPPPASTAPGCCRHCLPLSCGRGWPPGAAGSQAVCGNVAFATKSGLGDDSRARKISISFAWVAEGHHAGQGPQPQAGPVMVARLQAPTGGAPGR